MKRTESDRPPPESRPDPQALEELAGQIHQRFLQLENTGTPDRVQDEAAKAFDFYHQRYLELGGKPFQTTENYLHDLVTLETQCQGEATPKPPDSRPAPIRGEWSRPMKNTEIREALGLDSYYALSRLAEKGVYQLRQDPNNRQQWMIRLDTLDSETRQRFGKA